MAFTAKDVAELRKQTGCGMMDCKNALVEADGDFDKAIKVAMDYADNHPGTLVVVVADHETGGLSIPSNKTDFTLPESGIGYNFGTGSHTAALIPVYLYGTGAEQVNGIMENTDLSWKLQQLLGVGEK